MVNSCSIDMGCVLTVVRLPPELWADDGGEDLGQDAHPRLLVHNVQLLQPLAHGPRQHVIRLQEPAPARTVLLRRGPAVAISGEEDNLVLVSLQQVVLLGQPRQDVGQQRVEVGLVGVGHGGGIEDEDGPPFFGRKGRAVQYRCCGLCHLCRVVGALAGWRHS